MRFRHINSNVETLWVPVTIKVKDAAGFLSAKDRSRYLDFDIQVCVTIRRSSADVFVSYDGQWATPPSGNYPSRILDAIDKYLAHINVAEKFKEEINRY